MPKKNETHLYQHISPSRLKAAQQKHTHTYKHGPRPGPLTFLLPDLKLL